jgi:branched-chain amino acid transport system permease protein
MQALVNGLVAGAEIAVLAVAFQAVYLSTRIFFLALAGIYTAVPFVAESALAHGLPWFVAVSAVVALAVVMALAFDCVNHAPLSARRASPETHLVSSLGLSIVTVQLVAMIWGDQPRTLRVEADHVFAIGGVRVAVTQCIVVAAALVTLGGLALLLHRSDLGRRLRAMADSVVQCGLLGYDVAAHRRWSFGLAGALCAIASLLGAYDTGFDTQGGLDAVLCAVVAAILSGQTSFFAPVIGSLVLGVLRAQISWFVSARWQEAGTFALLAAFLLLRSGRAGDRVYHAEAR